MPDGSGVRLSPQMPIHGAAMDCKAIRSRSQAAEVCLVQR
jgi:hypothetical protein